MRRWTLEERKRQSELIKQWEPWKLSTSVTTPEGKANSKKNSYKHGAYCAEMKNTSRQLTEWKKELNQITGFLFKL